MKFKKSFIQKRIAESQKENPEARNILVHLDGSNPAHGYILSYDVNTRTVTGVVERVSKYKKRPISMSDIIDD